MNQQLIGYLICAAIVAFGLLHHLVDWNTGNDNDEQG